MAIIKCKMCGGDMELAADKTYGMCEFCGSTMTLPKIDDDQRAAAFNRGNHFRRIGEFDKALAVYERIVREDDTDAEAHWCCALCRFGIEYVEDPATYEWLPTCHRASFDSFLEDVDYKAAVEHSEGVTKRQYMKDGAKIAEVQRGILATSQNAEPYDVFICYKESDAQGERTRDSLMAQDIYYQLTEQGRKVFFARITLEDVAGAQYEPYIFAALNSAKVMIVVGTKPEYMNAVWVKNEWSRFLAMMKKDRHKLLLPCYRDMDPYDMPEQLSVLQSYDMTKIGFIQDLTRGIGKVLDAEKKPEQVKETVVVQQAAATPVAPLLKRAFIFLEDGDWKNADEYCERVLDMDPECAEAYIGKLMVELQVNKQDDLKDCSDTFDKRNNYLKAIRFADDPLKTVLAGYIEYIKSRNENAQLERNYTSAKIALQNAHNEESYNIAAQLFLRIRTYKDSDALAQQCIEKAEIARKDDRLLSARVNMQADTIVSCNVALGFLESISDWKDANEQIEICKKRIAELTEQAERERLAQEERERKEMLEREERARQQAEADRLAREERARQKAEAECLAREKAEANRIEAERIAKKKKKNAILVSTIVIVIIIVATIWSTVIAPNNKYNTAVALMDEEKYEDAIVAFEALGDYKDSVNKIDECIEAMFNPRYNDALAQMDAGKYDEAIVILESLNGYKDSTNLIYECNYKNACAMMDTGEYEEAILAFSVLDGFRDSADKIVKCQTMILDNQYAEAVALRDSGNLYAAVQKFSTIEDYKDAEEQIQQLWGKLTGRTSIFAAYGISVGIRNNGKLRVAGRYDDAEDIFRRDDIISIVSSTSWSSEHTIGLCSDGTVVAVGDNQHGQCDVTLWHDIVAIDTCEYMTVGLKKDGTVVATGYEKKSAGYVYDFDQCETVSDWSNIVAISTSYQMVAGLQSDGTVVLAGLYPESVLKWTDIVAIDIGSEHIVGLKSDGTVVAETITLSFSSGNTYGQYGQCDGVGSWTDIVAISADGNCTIGLKADGTVVATGENGNGQCNVSTWKNIVAISTSGTHTIGLKSDGTVVSTGNNKYGQCDIGAWTDIKLPN